ncbi:hypothetical protein Tco_0014464 [Tanacetum coccineum]
MPSFPSPEPTVSCFYDLDFFKDFENEFPSVVNNDAPTSKSDLLTEPTLNPQHIDKFDLKYETSLSEYDEEEENVLYFNDLFPFNIIQPDDLKSKKDNDDNERTRGLPDLMAERLSAMMLMEHRDAQGFIARLAEHFGLLMDDTWAWVALGPERQPDVAAGAPGVAQDAPVIDEGDQTIPAPVQAPPPPTAAGQMLCQIGWPELEETRIRIVRAIARQATKTGRPHESNIDKYWWRIYKSGDLEVLES